MILQNGKTTLLQGKDISYILIENQDGDLLNFHFGAKLPDRDYSVQSDLWIEAAAGLFDMVDLSAYPQEYPNYGHNDIRNPAYQVVNGFGNTISRLKVTDYITHPGQVARVEGMPCLHADDGKADTLEVVLEDSAARLEVRLFYTVFENHNAIARHAVLYNRGQTPMTLRSAYSASLDLPCGEYDLIHFAGDWGRERGMERTPLRKEMKLEAQDTTGRGSRRVNPFVMLASADADETNGNVYGLNLIYSCNHSTVAHMDGNGRVRIQQGISPLGFSWELQPGAHFCTPQCVLCYSDSGFGKLSQTYHDLYRQHLMRSSYTHKPRPVLINNWEATYFNFDEEKILSIARKAKDAGIELMVLDDGWFGKRNQNNAGLGDWFSNMDKLPSGIEGLAKKVTDLGMAFGLWFEPEMVNPDSDLFRTHPDWIVRTPQMEPMQQRWQYVLDLSRKEVCDYVIEAVSKVLRCGYIRYVKWDMNRNITDTPCEGYYHRYALGLYRLMEGITRAFPNILFEGCCSGGGRFDPAVLAYMPQIWTSDNSDAISRLKIQYGTSMCYPVSTMGAHVTAVPNHQTGRVTSLKTRADVAYAGVFGYELDITKMTPEELEQIGEQIAMSKRIQPLVLEGDFYRLRSPYETNECIWQLVSKEKDHVFLMSCRVLSVIGRDRRFEPKVCFRGLDPDGEYQDVATGKIYSGALLMYRGITIRYKIEDFTTQTMELRKC